MKLRSSVLTATEAPPPAEVHSPTNPQPDSFDFLALPEEIRMYVYRLCLVSKDEISFDEGFNKYCIVNHHNGQPAGLSSTGPGRPLLARQPILIRVPANFVHPRNTNGLVKLVPPSNFLSPTSTMPNPQVIPMANVVQPADLSIFPTITASAKTSLQEERGVYIGPVHAAHSSYSPPCLYTPFVGFNARILQTCKTIHAEALPILYGKNRFVLHSKLPHEKFPGPFAGHLFYLRLDIDNFKRMVDEGGSNSQWSRILRQCKQLQNLVLSFGGSCSYGSITFTEAVIWVAANIADVKKGTGQPKMTMRAVIEDVPRWILSLGPSFGPTKTEQIMAKKTHAKMQVPRGLTLKLEGTVEKEVLLFVQEYTRKGWCFRRKSPENDSELVAGTWVELEWVNSEG